MKIQSYKRLNTSDYEEEQKPLIDQLGNALNTPIEELIALSNNRIDFEQNIKSVVRQITVIVNTGGIPQGNISIGFAGVLTNPIGTFVVRTQNQTNPASYPTSGVQLAFNQVSTTTIQVNHITGLVAGNTYLLTVIVF